MHSTTVDDGIKRHSPPAASDADRRPPYPDSDSHSIDEDIEAATPQATKRKRPVSVSCELCKHRKVRCDRDQPSCGWCKRNGATCEYKERKPPGLRAGFGKFLENRSRELEQRLEKVEEILRKHSEILQNSSNSQTHEVTAQLDLYNPPRDSGHQSVSNQIFKRPQPPTAIQVEFDSLLRPPQPPAFSQDLQQNAEFASQHHSGSEMHERHRLHAKSMSVTSSVETPDAQGPTRGQVAASVKESQGTANPAHNELDDLPPYNLLYNLVDLFFKHINTWCPVLHRKSTMDNLFGISDLQQSDRILLHAIVATTMRYSNDPRLTEERRRHYHQVSKQKVLIYGMENSSVKSLLSLVILSLDLCGSSNGPPGWNILALITRSVVQLGLAVESTSFSVAPQYTSIYTLRAMILPEPKDFIEEESRRRLFWMIYLLDRYATISTAFEFALDDKEIDRLLPCRDDLWVENQKVETRWFEGDDPSSQALHEHQPGKPENLGAFAYYIQILGIFSKIHKFLKQPVDISRLSDVERWQLRYKELDKEIASWNYGLPGEFGNMAKAFQPGCRNLNCNWIMLHATYHTAVIRLHSSAAYPTTRSPIFTPSYRASQRCHNAVGHIATLGEFVINNGFLPKLGPPFAFTIWVAARVLLVHGSTVEHKLSPQISFFVDILRETGRYWPVAARYCALLQRVLDEHRDSERQGEGVTPNSVKILADMRRTAFDLDFLISRQPHQSAPAILSRGGTVTPSRTPAPNDLEYLDVFDFFNVPRLPFGIGEQNTMSGAATEGMVSDTAMQTDNGLGTTQYAANEFNITNFMVDANSDWLFKSEGEKFLAS